MALLTNILKSSIGKTNDHNMARRFFFCNSAFSEEIMGVGKV